MWLILVQRHHLGEIIMLIKNLAQLKRTLCEVSDILLQDFYVNDLLKSVKSEIKPKLLLNSNQFLETASARDKRKSVPECKFNN